TLDLLFNTNQSIIAEVYVPVAHNLMNRSGRLEDVECVMAHPQALAQCRGWLAAHLPSVRIESRASNAEAAVQASRDSKVAAIASSRAAELYCLAVVAEAVQDEPRNRTRFVVLGPKPAGRMEGVTSKTSLVFSVNNTAGSLFKALEPLSVHEVSMTKLESRPSRHGAWEYNFYVDLEGHFEDANVARALVDIAGMASYIKVLGSYPMADDQ
ncbi:MAG: prephenate dehydratase, partial [Duodenibacillus sp.]